jgi:hypothetical protein
MTYEINGKKAVFQYYGSDDATKTELDITEWYLKLGGTIETDTKIDFVAYFPGTAYAKTALTEKMPDVHLCEGSGSAVFYHSNGQTDHLAISVYRDLTGHNPTLGDHRNLRLQYQFGNNKPGQVEYIPNNHIPLKDSVILKAIYEEEEIFSSEVKATSRDVAQFYKTKKEKGI